MVHIGLSVWSARVLEQSWRALNQAHTGVPWMIPHFKMRRVGRRERQRKSETVTSKTSWDGSPCQLLRGKTGMVFISEKVKHMARRIAMPLHSSLLVQERTVVGDTGTLSGNCYVLGGKSIYFNQLKSRLQPWSGPLCVTPGLLLLQNRGL